nr:NAD-dependent malic enzyme [Clostridiales bacterium]
HQRGPLTEIIRGKDVFIGVSAPRIVTSAMISTMAKDAIVFAMANPTPEIMPEDARAGGARIVATGRSDYPNQINNVLVFPGLFRGALMVEARQIVEEMKLAAARAIASLCAEDELTEDYIIPGAFDRRVAATVAEQVAVVAEQLGIAGNPGNRAF